MRKWTAVQVETKSEPNRRNTEDPTKSSVRCGKWLLRSTKIRRSRGDKAIEGKLPVTSQSVTSSANSFTGENNVDLDTMDRTKIDVDMWSYANEQIHAYESVALANQKKAAYYEALTVSRQQSGPPTNSIKDTIAALDQIQEVVGDTQYWKAYGLMMGPEGPSWREGFMQLTPHNRIGWVSQLQ